MPQDQLKPKDVGTLFNPDIYQHFEYVTICHFAYGFVVFMSAVLLYQFFKRRNFFPIRERAPRIAILQLAIYTLLMVLLWVIEIGSRFNLFDKWTPKDSASEDIPWTRGIFKSLYTTVRMNIYTIFLVRYINLILRIGVIFYSWQDSLIDDQMMPIARNNDPRNQNRGAGTGSMIKRVAKKIISSEQRSMLVRLFYDRS